MKKFEYLTIKIDTGDWDEEHQKHYDNDWSDFNRYGADGWELVTAVGEKYRTYEYNADDELVPVYYKIYYYTFKREVK